MHELYIFNPEHDSAIAVGAKKFDTPKVAFVFEKDCRMLPLWYAQPSATIWTDIDENWESEIKELFPQLNTIQICADIEKKSFSSLVPWGWNAHLLKRAAREKVTIENHPTADELDNIRTLSHRRTAIEGLLFLREESSFVHKFPEAANEFFSVQEVDFYIKNNKPSILKMPWSGSGRGLNFAIDPLPSSFPKWCKNAINKQLSLIVEPLYNKTIDFAMEFECKNATTKFAGYSLFENSTRGAYSLNKLLSNKEIETILEKEISPSLLHETQQLLMLFINQKIAPSYNGYLGVDMFLYQENNETKIHPCVEINIRMTMGMVARLFYDNFVLPKEKGSFQICYFKNSLEAHDFRKKMSELSPLDVTNGRITKGCLFLTPKKQDEHFVPYIKID